MGDCYNVNPQTRLPKKMNSNKLPKLILTEPVAAQSSVMERQWPALLRLVIAKRGQRTCLLATEHFGPLRVQRPFYPETNDCCHIYLLHPPWRHGNW